MARITTRVRSISSKGGKFEISLILSVLLLFGASDARAQGPEIEVSAAMDRVYERFTRAYRLAEPDSVLALYTDRPLYLPGQGPVVVGREAVKSQFGFLDAIRQRSASALISFESVERGGSGDVAWDVGYYALSVREPDGTVSPENRGKFTTIWHRDDRGQWRIHVDSFSPAPPERR